MLLRLIARLNEDPAVHGIMLELPLPGHLSASKIEQAISPKKDIDGVTPRNKLATVTGDVGLPLFHMLQRENATVTVCHSRTPDIALHLGHAEVAFVAVGRPDVVRRDMVHPELTVVDAGINEGENGKIVGDVAADVEESVKALSPVPGGVGTLTTAILFENLMKAIDIQLGEVNE